MSATEGRAPTAPEIMRDVELVIDERLREERRRRRSAERIGRISLVIAVISLLGAALIAYALYDGRGPGINSGVIRTGELRLVDADGNIRGRWQVLPGGATRLALLDAAGVERMRMTLLENGAQGISLADARGEGRVVLSLEGGEGSRLTFADAAGRPRTVLGLSGQQDGTLLFADEGGTPRVAVGLERDGRATFALPAERSVTAPAPAQDPDNN
jgi:hypothetical protein